MILLQILLGLLTERAFPHLKNYRWFDWLYPYLAKLQAWLPTPWFDSVLGVLLVWAVPVLVIGSLVWWLDGVLFGFFSFFVGVMLLFYSLGPEDLDAQIDELLIALEHDDAKHVEQGFAQLTAMPVEPELAKATSQSLDAIFSQAHTRMFGVLFWFICLGPAGAVGFRISVLLQDHVDEDCAGFRVAAQKLTALLMWLPLRVSAAAYALAGSFEGAVEAWRSHHEQAGYWVALDALLLARIGRGALQVQQANWETPQQAKEIISEARRLVQRSLIIWLVVLAILTLGNWLV